MFELKGIFVSFPPSVILLPASTGKEDVNKLHGLRTGKQWSQILQLTIINDNNQQRMKQNK